MEVNGCEPCQTRGIHAISVTKCVDCDEALCAACTDHHRSMKALRNHQLVDITTLPAQFVFGTQTCEDHKNLAYEYFCIDHDVLCCKECLAEVHRKCTKVMSIDVACKGCKQSQTFVDYSELLEGVLNTVLSLREEKTVNKQTIEKESESIQNEISKAKLDLFQRIEAYEKQLLKELDEKKQKSLSEIDMQQVDIKKIEKNTFEKMERFEFVKKYGNDRQAFILSHSTRKELNDIESNLEDVVQDSNNFKLNWKQKSVKDEELSFGSVDQATCTSSVKCNFKKKLQSQAPSVSHINKKIVSFSFDSKLDLASAHGALVDGIILTNDNYTLLLCDNSKMLVYDRFNVYQMSVALKHRPWDIVAIPGTACTRAVVTPAKDEDEILQIVPLASAISNKRDPNKIETKKIQGICMAGIAITDQNIFIGGKFTLSVLDHQCNLQRTIQNFHKGHYIIWSICLCDTNPNQIWFSDSNEVVCSSIEGNEVTTYESSELREPTKLTKDKHGYIYVAGRQSNDIHRFKPDGTSADIVLEKKNDISCPLALCFDKTFTKLYISHKNGLEVIIFNVISS